MAPMASFLLTASGNHKSAGTELAGTGEKPATMYKTQILEAKKRKGLSWEKIAAQVDRSPVFVTSACLGQNSLSPEEATKLCALLDLGSDVSEALQTPPMKAADSLEIPKDPLIYRFHEITLVYGETIKELIHEKFGDGIMSAIDFTMEIGKVEDPKGDRVQITMCGKFLPYKRW
jgi:cyanate lyase